MSNDHNSMTGVLGNVPEIDHEKENGYWREMYHDLEEEKEDGFSIQTIRRMRRSFDPRRPDERLRVELQSKQQYNNVGRDGFKSTCKPDLYIIDRNGLIYECTMQH